MSFWSNKVFGIKCYIHVLSSEKVIVSQASESVPQGLKFKSWSSGWWDCGNAQELIELVRIKFLPKWPPCYGTHRFSLWETRWENCWTRGKEKGFGDSDYPAKRSRSYKKKEGGDRGEKRAERPVSADKETWPMLLFHLASCISALLKDDSSVESKEAASDRAPSISPFEESLCYPNISPCKVSLCYLGRMLMSS